MAKSSKISAGERSAKLNGIYSTKNQIIAGSFLLASVLLGWVLTNKDKQLSKSSVQDIQDQTIDSGSINNYNAKGNITIENHTYPIPIKNSDSSNSTNNTKKNKSLSPSEQQKHAEVNVTSNNQSGGQTANQIINNN